MSGSYKHSSSPLMSRESSAHTLGPLSMGLPLPLKTRPNMSSETASFMDAPEKAIRVAQVSTPEVPSKTLGKVSVWDRNIRSILDLHDSLLPANLEHLTTADGPIG